MLIFIVIVLIWISVVIALAFYTNIIKIECGVKDFLCPKNCDYTLDPDCPKPTDTTKTTIDSITTSTNTTSTTITTTVIPPLPPVIGPLY